MTEHPVFQVAVTRLADFGRGGDINFRFSSRSSALEGVRGHQWLARRRGNTYQSERSVQLLLPSDDYDLKILGRVDGFDSEAGFVEEIKTTRQDPDEIPASVKDVHMAQLKLYGHMLAEELELDSLTLQLCYLDLNDRQEHLTVLECRADELARFFLERVTAYRSSLSSQREWMRKRDASIIASDFPYGDFRAGQRDLAVIIFRLATLGRQAVLQAPTGIGKTMATLFPAIKAMPLAGTDKIFFLSAKTSGQQMAERSVEDLNKAGFSLRSVTLTAKDKICFNPGEPCDPEHCEFADGYYNRLGNALKSVQPNALSLGRREVETLARQHQLCPFELSLDLANWVDVIICDYNYVFDPFVYLRRFLDEEGRYMLLLDEAHNLVDRGRDMFTASLGKSEILIVRKLVKPSSPLVASNLSTVNTQFLSLLKNSGTEGETTRFDELPEKLVSALRKFCEAAEDRLADSSQDTPDELLDLYFDSLRFLRIAEQVDDNYAMLLDWSVSRRPLVKLYCVDPASRLNTGFARMQSVACFSATMQPAPYFKKLLGVDPEADWYQVPSPFDPENLGVYVASFVDTSFRGRDQSRSSLVDLIASVTSAKAGNYLVFFPSYRYLEDTLSAFETRYPETEVIRQAPTMTDAQRQAFLDELKPGGVSLGFAVMGSVFSEGVDLVGDRLIGTIIVGVGLPQICEERELIKTHFEPDGFEYAYQYPGMTRVLQTAGRVIRSDQDRGIVCLVDTRFKESRYQDLFPVEWQVEVVTNQSALDSGLEVFWAAQGRG